MHTVIWRFTVKADRIADFERHYGADGSWAALFRRGTGYLGTELLRDTARANVYVTLDHWVSAQAMRDFKQTHHAAYAELDSECESLTEREELMGTLS